MPILVLILGVSAFLLLLGVLRAKNIYLRATAQEGV